MPVLYDLTCLSQFDCFPIKSACFIYRPISVSLAPDAPVCEEPPPGETRKVYVAGVGRPVNVSCGVLASPPAVRFSWVFNNTVASERLPGDQVFTTPGNKTLTDGCWNRKEGGKGGGWEDNRVRKRSTLYCINLFIFLLFNFSFVHFLSPVL